MSLAQQAALADRDSQRVLQITELRLHVVQLEAELILLRSENTRLRARLTDTRTPAVPSMRRRTP